MIASWNNPTCFGVLCLCIRVRTWGLRLHGATPPPRRNHHLFPFGSNRSQEERNSKALLMLTTSGELKTFELGMSQFLGPAPPPLDSQLIHVLGPLASNPPPPPFIAAFGRNGAKKHYQPVSEVVADKSCCSGIWTSEDGCKHAKQDIKHA